VWLATRDETAGASAFRGYYGALPRGFSCEQGSFSTLTAPLGSFASAGGRIVIHDGVFACQMHRTQVVQDDNYAEYTVYVLRCSWQPHDARESMTWLVSHRFSVIERLHKDLKHKIPPMVATLPSFPHKHLLGGVFADKTGTSSEIVEVGKQGLERYVAQVLELRARLSNTLNVPELDRLLNLSRQAGQYRRQLAKNADATPVSAGGPGFARALNIYADGAKALAACKQATLPT